jgi:hypothetical protein
VLEVENWKLETLAGMSNVLLDVQVSTNGKRADNQKRSKSMVPLVGRM